MKNRGLIKWLIGAATVLAAAFLISTYLYRFTIIRGDSMLPAYKDGQFNIINRWDRSYAAGDVVVFYCDGLEETLVKRVAACPGDTVLIKGGILSVNGETPEFYAGTVFAYGGIAESEVRLQEDEYFVIGDNTEVSKDSRYKEVGPVIKNRITGKLVF